MVGCVSNALTGSVGASALQAARDLYASNNPVEKMVDRRGFAPRTAGLRLGVVSHIVHIVVATP
jgi:hypothetical protein